MERILWKPPIDEQSLRLTRLELQKEIADKMRYMQIAYQAVDALLDIATSHDLPAVQKRKAEKALRLLRRDLPKTMGEIAGP